DGSEAHGGEAQHGADGRARGHGHCVRGFAVPPAAPGPGCRMCGVLGALRRRPGVAGGARRLGGAGRRRLQRPRRGDVPVSGNSRGPRGATPVLTLDVHLGPEDMAGALRLDVLAGLTSSPKELPPRWFYDEAGCALFDDITRLDEYYLTRREREILDAHASDIAAATGADTLVELGSGTSEKTRLLLDALAGAGTLRRFVPFDISEPTLRSAAEAIAGEYPGTSI